MKFMLGTTYEVVGRPEDVCMVPVENIKRRVFITSATGSIVRVDPSIVEIQVFLSEVPGSSTEVKVSVTVVAKQNRTKRLLSEMPGPSA